MREIAQLAATSYSVLCRGGFNGVTIAQAPDTASSRDMPMAAIRTGAVDYILEPDMMAGQLERIAEELKSRVA